jgi:hypothetical protein
MSKPESLTGHLSPRAAIRVLQLHRLLVFGQIFDDYLAGRASASQVKASATKMLQAGLPERLK